MIGNNKRIKKLQSLVDKLAELGRSMTSEECHVFNEYMRAKRLKKPIVIDEGWEPEESRRD
jgi:hypothetical protein